MRSHSHRIPGTEAVCVDEESAIIDGAESSNRPCLWGETGAESMEDQGLRMSLHLCPSLM